MTGTMADLIRRTEQGRFVGRREEQRVFSKAIDRLIQMHSGELPQDEYLFRHIFLLHGEGGMGKTTLFDRFAEICHEKGGKKLVVIKIDWEDYKTQPINSSMDIMDIIYGRISNAFYKEMKLYRETHEKKEQVRRKADKAREEFGPLVSTFAENLSKVTGTGSVGKTAIEQGVHSLATKLAESEDQINEWVQRKLTSQEFTLYKNPQLEMSKAFVAGFKDIAEQRPIVLMFDTYEHIDRYNGWVRDGLIRHGSHRIIYVISGRNDHTATYRDIFPEELIHEAILKSFSRLDVEDYLRAWDIPVSDKLNETVSKITRGVPLAVKAVAKVLYDHIDIQNVFGDLAAIPLLEKEQIIGEVTRRFLRYCMGTHEDTDGMRASKALDRNRIYTLALIRQHSDRTHREKILKTLWQDSEGEISEEQVEVILQDLALQYSFIFDSSADMHPTVKKFIRMSLRDQHIPRGATTKINRRAYEFAATKMATIKGDAGDLYRREDFQEYCLDCLNHLLWIDSHEAMRFLAKHFVSAMEANPEFSKELLTIISEDAYEHLSDEHKRVVWALRNVATWTGGTPEQVAAAEKVREMLFAWLDREDQIRAYLLRAKDMSRRGKKGIKQALMALEQAEQLCETPDEMGLVRVEVSVKVAEALANIGRVKRAISLLQKSVTIDSTNPQAYMLLGRLLFRNGDIEKAIETYETALSVGIRGSYLTNELQKMRELIRRLEQGDGLDQVAEPRKFAKILAMSGNVLASEGLLDRAVEKYRLALSADQEYAQAYVKLGHALRQLGQFVEAEHQFHLAKESPSPYVQALAYDGLGAVNKQKGNLANAISMYNEAIRLNPKYANAYNGLGKVNCMQGHYQKAEASLRSALKYKPDAHWTFNNLGLTFLKSKREDEAIQSFQKATLLCQEALGKESRVYLSYFNLGIALIGKGEYTEGLLGLRKATSICTAPGLLGEVVSDLELIDQEKPSERIKEAISFLKEIASPQE